jgi:hypothetical protein
MLIPEVCDSRCPNFAEMVDRPRAIPKEGSSVWSTVTRPLIGKRLPKAEYLPRFAGVWRCPLQGPAVLDQRCQVQK